MGVNSSLRPAAQYVRVSTDMQRYSSENQKTAIANYARENGFEIVRTYVDENRSGVTIKGRTGLSALLTDVMLADTPFKAILVLDVSRWGRYQDPDEAAHYEFLCKSAGTVIHYCAENFEFGPTGSIVKQLKRVMAGEYSRELSAKVTAAKRYLGNQGFVQGGKSPYGIAKIEILVDGSVGRVLERGQRKGRLEYSLRYIAGRPDEIAVVRRIFFLYVKKKKYPAEIASVLNLEGSTYYDGKRWKSQQIRRVIRCELLTGVQHYGRTSCFLSGPRIKNPRDSWATNQAFEPIISRRDFLAAERRREWFLATRRKTDEALLDELRRASSQVDRLSVDIVDSSKECASSASYYRRFGTLGNAISLIGEPPRLNRLGKKLGRPITREDLIAALKDLERRSGCVSCRRIRAAVGVPAAQTYRAHFGSMEAAYKAAEVRQCPKYTRYE